MKPRKKYLKRVRPIIAELRAARGSVPRKILALRLGHSVATIGRWERGETMPSFDALHDWAAYFRRPVRLGESSSARPRT